MSDRTIEEIEQMQEELADSLVDEYEDYVDPMAPLAEEKEATPLAPASVPLNNPTHRRLRAIAGATVPYLFLTFPPTGQVTFDFWGIPPENLPELFDQLKTAVAV